MLFLKWTQEFAPSAYTHKAQIWYLDPITPAVRRVTSIVEKQKNMQESRSKPGWGSVPSVSALALSGEEAMGADLGQASVPCMWQKR